jgi:hypothetical protein
MLTGLFSYVIAVLPSLVFTAEIICWQSMSPASGVIYMVNLPGLELLPSNYCKS